MFFGAASAKIIRNGSKFQNSVKMVFLKKACELKSASLCCEIRARIALLWNFLKLNSQNFMTTFTLEIDAIGLNCPMPLLKLKKALNQLNSNDIVKILVTDPAAHLDFGVFCQQVSHEIISITKNENIQTFLIKKA